jgi:aminoglycoside 2'-N-acetyltransferase I
MVAMAELQTAHTAELDAATLTAARAFLYDVFDDMTDHDWEHALGGVHALVWEGADLIGHASVIQRRLLHGGRALRTGYVEGVGVRVDRRGRGHGAAMMDALETVVRGAYELGALGATDEAAAFMQPAAGCCGEGRPRRSPRLASGVPRKTTAASMSCRRRSRWICPAS